jgi:hypothetical protein
MPPVDGLRRGATVAQLVLACAVVVGVFAQVYLIGAYIFGAGTDALNAHKDLGGVVHALEVLTLVASLVARLPRNDLLLSLALAVVGTIQLALADSEKWVGGLHPLFAMFVLVLAGLIARRGFERRRLAEPAA